MGKLANVCVDHYGMAVHGSQYVEYVICALSMYRSILKVKYGETYRNTP